MHVLIVDDDELNCQALRRVLCAFHSVSTAVTVADALEKINAAEPDVLLCDYELDGEVATRLLRIVGREHPRVRRVLYSGVVTERLNACLSEGLAEQTLEKPAELEEILAAISGSA